MPYALILGLLLLALVALAARSFTGADPHILAQGLRAFAAAFAALSMTGLLLAGRFGLALVALGAAVMAWRAMQQAGGAGATPEGRSSEVGTDTLRMSLDHATGEIDGNVLQGPFAGGRLNDMGLSDLIELLAWCRREDPPSVALLQTYLDRREPDWRDHVDADASAGTGPRPRDGEMSEATALEILGLQSGCTADEVKAAHRALMAKLHPDRGGSTFLAAQINHAKDVLLARRR
jgi:hypothetical protein